MLLLVRLMVSRTTGGHIHRRESRRILLLLLVRLLSVVIGIRGHGVPLTVFLRTVFPIFFPVLFKVSIASIASTVFILHALVGASTGKPSSSSSMVGTKTVTRLSIEPAHGAGEVGEGGPGVAAWRAGGTVELCKTGAVDCVPFVVAFEIVSV